MSVLLGGLKVFLVNDGGKPLSAPGGRVKFYLAGTSTPETVYSDMYLTEGTALGPVVYTNELGYLPVVWLKTDRLYKVRVEQKIQDDPETWNLLWEVDNVGRIEAADPQDAGSFTYSVDTLSDLKEVNRTEHTSVMVGGYYSRGDWGEPSLFVWDASSTKSPDDGAYVLPNDFPATGRWVQVFPGDIIDVRKFGALPDLTQNTDVTAKIVNAVNYSQQNSTRTRPLTIGFLAPGRYVVSGNLDLSQYTFTDLTDNSTHKINWLIEKDVVFKNVLQTLLTLTLANTTDCRTTEELVEGNVTLAVEAGGFIVVDPAWWGQRPCSVSGCTIRCTSVTSSHKSFTDCVIDSCGALDGVVSLDNCGFSSSWFASGYDWSGLTLSNTVYSVFDCVDANEYVDVKNSQSDNNYGSLNNGTVASKTLHGGIVSDANLSACILDGDINMSSVTGTIAGATNGIDIGLSDCDLTFSVAVTLGNVQGRDSTITGDNVLTCDYASFEGGALNITLSTEKFFANGCNIQKIVNSIATAGGVINGSITNCTLSATHVLMVPAGFSGTVSINFVWKGNRSTASPAVNHASVDPYVSGLQNYIYADNSGTFLPSRIPLHLATSYSVTEDIQGWTVIPTFPNTNVFVIGSRDIIVDVHVIVNGTGNFNLGGSISKKSTITSETVTFSNLGVMMPDVTSSTNVVMKELCRDYPSSTEVYVSVEVQ